MFLCVLFMVGPCPCPLVVMLFFVMNFLLFFLSSFLCSLFWPAALFLYDVYEKFSCVCGISLIWKLCVHYDDLPTFWPHLWQLYDCNQSHAPFRRETQFRNFF